MRRARIKAMATLPARRKATRENADESTEQTNVVPSEKTAEEKPAEQQSSCVETSKEIVTETPEVKSLVEEETPKIQESTQVTQEIESPVIDKSVPSVQKILETTTSITEESTDESKVSTVQENSQTSALDETRVPTQECSSPTKVSQTRTSFMRPTPRLDGGGRMRRNSVQGSGASASESEDDCRRVSSGVPSRVRNDSISSVHSPKGISQSSSAANTNITENNSNANNNTSPPIAKNSSSARQKRKAIVSESARKLAEARREFLLKHEHKQPDRAKLIMYDLIYYNPVSNPMKKSDGSASVNQRTSSAIARPETEDEEEDDPDAGGEAMPVPQVKVGPDGSLMIDEQSLVIEHTGAKKNRAALARTEALVDEENNGSGFYKKRQKSRDWPEWETLKFYKALNTVGTDFLLMQSLFPQRTRQEIKMKFKKEEKINQRLVHKALTYHQEFDIELLKEDLATFEEETKKKKSESVKPEKRPASRQGGRGKTKKNRSRRMAARSIGEMNDDADSPEDSFDTASCKSVDVQEDQLASKTEQRKSIQRRSTTANAARTRSESTGSSCDSASDTEIYQVKPTRSGRRPKVRKLQAPTINTLDNIFSDPEQENEIPASPATPSIDHEAEAEIADVAECQEKNNEPIVDKEIVEKSQIVHNSLDGISQVEPGSLVIVSRESAEDPGETVLQVYMVSSDIDEAGGNGHKQNMTPVVLTPELLNTVTAGITKVAPIDVKRI